MIAVFACKENVAIRIIVTGKQCHKMTERNAQSRPTRGRASGVAPERRRDLLRWLRQRIEQLPLRQRTGHEPGLPLGTRVLVLKGHLLSDLGQMAIVSKIAGSQVEISYRDLDGTVKTRRKHRGSLIRMEEGLELVVDDNEGPVIRRMIDGNGDESDVGVVSSEDDDNA
jgi:hypothetical protein